MTGIDTEQQVEAEPIRTYITQLRDLGWGWKLMAKISGVPQERLRHIHAGTVTHTDRSSLDLLRIPLVDPSGFRVDPNPTVPAGDTITRLELLRLAGYSARWLADKVFGTSKLQITSDQVSVARARGIAAAEMALLHGQPGMLCARCREDLLDHDPRSVKQCRPRKIEPAPQHEVTAPADGHQQVNIDTEDSSGGHDELDHSGDGGDWMDRSVGGSDPGLGTDHPAVEDLDPS